MNRIPLGQASYNHIHLISKNAHRRVESFRLVKKSNSAGEAGYEIKRNHFLAEQFLRLKHAFGDKGKTYREKLWSIIEAEARSLNQLDQSAYLNRDQTYTKLFVTAQKYNHMLEMSKNPHFKKEVPLFEQLHLSTSIGLGSCSEIAPVKTKPEEIVQSDLENIPADQKPYISNHGKKKFYRYAKESAKLSHGKEAFHIFFNTQCERLISLLGRIVEVIGKIFGVQVRYFSRYHYFRNGEESGNHIYAQDLPLANSSTASSYWIGHATCLLSIPQKTNQSSDYIRVNIITDPVEGDLNKFLYPRMTHPACTMENCPLPHIFMLSHNHLDHFDRKTIQKLKKYQPIMLVPKEDARRFREMGFENVYEHNWWQTTTIPIEQGDKRGEVKITAVPANHWSGDSPHTAYQSATLGYVIHREEGDIYFAGDTARLSEGHIATLRERFNIRSMFQPGGPDELRKYMKSTHQASGDGLWMHFNLMIRNLYDKGMYANKHKSEFIEETKKLRTLYMHTKTFKLGNLHFDDTDASVLRIKEALRVGRLSELKVYEKQVYHEILAIGQRLQFQDGNLNPQEIFEILDAGVIVPKIGSRTELH